MYLYMDVNKSLSGRVIKHTCTSPSIIGSNNHSSVVLHGATNVI